MTVEPLDPKRVFISYSHDSETHKDWVRELAEYLTENGIKVFLDQWDVGLGDDLAAFMEHGIRKTDRVLAICTDKYVEKANSGSGGVGYEKTIATAEILRSVENRRRFIPIVREVAGDEKLPAFFGAALYLDLSDGNDNNDNRKKLLHNIYEVPPTKPPLGASPFIPQQAPPTAIEANPNATASLSGSQSIVEFSDRFARAFPGVRGVEWFENPEVIAERLDILLQSPLIYGEGNLAGWWRGPQNLEIKNFRHIEAAHFLMDIDELNVSRIAAVNLGIYYQTFVYFEAQADEPTGLYPATEDSISRQVQNFGYANEEYGLVDDKLPVTRAEYDDGAAIIEGKPVDIAGRVKLRNRYITPYNFVIAPQMSPINNGDFDYVFQDYLNRILLGEDVFGEMCESISRLPKREL